MLLNKDNFPYMDVRHYPHPHGIIEYRQGNAIFNLREWDDNDYWYIDFMRSEVFDYYPIETLVPEDVLNKIKTDEHTFLLLSNTHEAFHSIVDGLYQRLIINNKIPGKKIILMNESRDLHEEVTRVANKYNYPTVNVFWSLIFEHGLKVQTYNFIDRLPKTLEHKEYPKKFLNFNRRWRLHRPLIVAMLISNGLLDKGYVSLGSSDDNNDWTKVIDWLQDYVKNDEYLRNTLLLNRNKILETPPLYLDKTDLKTNWVENIESTKYLYENSLFSVVNETNFFTDRDNEATIFFPIEASRFLSEKALKPVANLHPFIIVSVPGFLDTMRELGYKTFHPYIDETYDTTTNDLDRVKLIIKEVDRLSNLTPEQEREFIENVTPIVKHNFHNLINKNQFIYKTL